MQEIISDLYEEFVNQKSDGVESEAEESEPKTEEGTSMPTQIDYVLVFDNLNEIDETLSEYKNVFEKMMKSDGLILTSENRNGLTFIKIYCPIDRLCKEAERVRLEMPLKGCDIPDKERMCCISILKKFQTDDEIDFVSGPFYSDRRHLYEGHEDPSTFFRSALRSFLVHHILINLDMSKKLSTNKIKRNQTIEERTQVDHARNDIVSRIGLPYLLMKKVYKDAFAPHDVSADDPFYLNIKKKSLDLYYATVPKLKYDARQDMNRTWTKITKFQPLWKIRDYFGEEIALYFAWQGTLITMLWIPAILGLIGFIYGLYLTFNVELCYESKNGVKKQIDSRQVNRSDVDIHCVFGTSAIKDAPHDVLDYFQKTFDNKLTPFISLMICIWSALFIEVWQRNNATLSYQWDCDVYEEAEPDRPEFFGTTQIMDPVTKHLTWVYPSSQRLRKYVINALVVIGMIIIVFVSVVTVTIIKSAFEHKLNCTTDNEDGTIDYNNEQKKGGSISCLVFVTCLPTLLNSISILILGYFYEKVARKLTRWENHRTSSEHKDALIIKLFAFQFVNTYTSLFYIAFFRPEEHGMQQNGLFGLGPNFQDTCKRGGCMSLLSLQVLSLMILKPLMKLVTDLIWPWLKSNYKKVKRELRIKTPIDDESLSKTRPTSTSQPDALVENFLEREYIKPKLSDFTLNEYSEKVIEFGYIVMFTASFPVAPLILLIISLIDLRVDAKRLLWFNRRPVAYIATDIGMWCPILRFVSFAGVISNAFIIAFTSSFCEDFFDRSDVNTTDRLFVVLVFEHAVFVTMYFLSVIISRTPADIRLAQRRERYEVARILEDNKPPDNNCPTCNHGGATSTANNTKDTLWLPATHDNTTVDKSDVISVSNTAEECRSVSGRRRTVSAWTNNEKGLKRTGNASAENFTIDDCSKAMKGSSPSSVNKKTQSNEAF